MTVDAEYAAIRRCLSDLMAAARQAEGRLANHAHCPESHKPRSKDCPFCEDIAAWIRLRDTIAKGYNPL
jgi:hypothetical protein